MKKVIVDKSKIPEKLKRLKQWVCWKYGSPNDGNRIPKIPINPRSGNPAKINNSKTWAVFKKAYHYYKKNDLDGIGFVFTENDPFCGIDLDDCRNKKTGKIEDWALEIINNVNSYTEISPSDTGVKIFIKGKLPGTAKRIGKVEMYDRDRYFTVTGQCNKGLPVKLKERKRTIKKLYDFLIKNKAAASISGNISDSPEDKKTTKPEVGENDDNFNRLYEGDWSKYNSQSEADLAFFRELLNKTAGNPEEADKLFRKSKLYRPKWDEKHSADGKTYGKMTIDKALSLYNVQLPKNICQALESDEQGDANIFTELNKGKLCYDHDENCWYVFGGTYWEKDKKKIALASIETMIDLYKTESGRLKHNPPIPTNDADTSEAGGGNNDPIKKIKDRIKKLNALGRRKRVLELSAAGENSLGITGDEWDTKPWTIACKNGILYLKRKEVNFHEGNPYDYIKTPVPTKWEGINAKAPVWKKALKEIFQNDKKLICHVQRMFGYALSGSCQHHVFNILNGVGRNGKSTIVETISHVLGELATPIPVETLLSQANTSSGGAPRADIMKLRSRRIAWASESDRNRQLNAAQIKLFTGGDKITARSPFSKEMVAFSPTHTIFMITNNMPHLDINDYALWQRIHVIPFQVSFVETPVEEFEKKADHKLKEKLKKEAPGILAWLVRGCLSAQKRGLKKPPAVTKAISEYRHKEDTLGVFIAECCKKSSGKRVKASKLFDAYNDWCKNTERIPLSQTKFGKEMGKIFKKKSSNGIYYYGLRLM